MMRGVLRGRCTDTRRLLSSRLFSSRVEGSSASSRKGADGRYVFSSMGVGFVAAAVFMGGASLLASSEVARRRNVVFCEEVIRTEAGGFRPDLKEISLEEVEKHKTAEDRIWVTYKGGVYDITDFVENHPGGPSKIVLAAGGSIEPYWALYAQHQEAHVYEILEEMRIGNLKAEDQAANQKSADANDPYATDPQRSPLLLVRSKKPFNAEPPLQLLDSEMTPNDLFYIRNHLPVPHIDPATYRLELDAKDGRKLNLSLEDIKTKFPKHKVTVTIMCAGNRRNEMDAIKTVKGGYWDAGAISTATWTGALLSDVLKEAGIEETDVNHVQFEGLDKDAMTNTIYGASIHAELAFDPRSEVLLAYEMNDEPIPADHGYPIRAVIPGVVGARNVKWLGKIIASDEESPSHWQQNDYKGFHPSIDWHNVDFSKAQAIEELPVVSAICDTVVEGDDEITVKGYAYSGGGRGIIRVDVTPDDGQTWVSADLSPADETQKRNHVYGWTLWTATVKIPAGTKGKVSLACRAVDSQYNGQPESSEKIWNLRGVLSNAWHRREVTIE